MPVQRLTQNVGSSSSGGAGAEPPASQRQRADTGGLARGIARADGEEMLVDQGTKPDKKGRGKGSYKKVEGEMMVPKDLMLALMKNGLRVAQRIRKLEGSLLVCFETLPGCDATKSVLGAGTAYAKQIRAAGKGHELGPPHLHKFLALMEHFSKTPPEKLPPQEAKKLKDIYEECEKMEIEDLDLVVPSFGSEELFKTGHVKLYMFLRLGNERNMAVAHAIRATGATQFTGHAAPDGLEWVLQEFMQKIK